MQWKNIYLFISSTFNDMHAERDYLVKNVFPELLEWCEARKIRLVDIDLRWGVTSADSQAKNTVLACLRNIDESRPFFLCFLGQRRGWVPKPDDVSEATISDYPGIRPYIGKNSVTEMEIEHALLSPMLRIVDEKADVPIPVSHALFFFRKEDFVKNLNDTQRCIYTNAALCDAETADVELARFKKKIRDNGQNITEYDACFDKGILSPELLPEGADAAQGRLTGFMTGGKPLREALIENLKAEIEKEFPGRDAVSSQTALEADLEQQELFIEQSREGFIPRYGDFDALDAYLSGTGRGLFVLTAPAGLGKTMLLAHYVSLLRSGGKRLYARFCGASDMASDSYSLWKSILEEAGVECPPTVVELRRDMEKTLETLAAKGRCILVIDAINQITDGLDMFSWLPRRLPEGLQMILSFKEDGESLPLIRRLQANPDISTASLRPFTEKGDKRALIDAYLEKYLKSLDEDLIDAVCNLPSSDNPLYLKILLSELRVYGAFRQLEQEIGRFGETPQEAFGKVLERLENDAATSAIAPRDAAGNLFGLLSCARRGLSETELAYCFKREFPAVSEEEIRSTIRLFIRQMRPFLARRQGRVDFLYESFLLAARERYAETLVKQHARLSECFRRDADVNLDGRFEGGSARALEELPFHMHFSKDDETLRKMLGDYLWLDAKVRKCGVDAAVSDYAYLGDTQKELALIRDCLRLSAPALRTDPSRFFDQLWGHLCEIETESAKDLLAQAADEAKGSVWLKPLCSIWNPPGGELKTIFNMESAWFPPVPALYKDKLYCIHTGDTIAIVDRSTGASTVVRKKGDSGSGCAVDGDRLIIAVKDQGRLYLEMWDMSEGRFLSAPPGLEGCADPLLVQGDVLIAAFGNQSLRVFDKNDFRLLGTLDFDLEIRRIAAVGEKIAVGFYNGFIGLYDIASGECLQHFFGHGDAILALALCGEHLVSGSLDAKTRVWNIRTGVCEKVVERVTSGICVRGGKMYTHGGWDGNIWIWDGDRFEVVDCMKGHGKAISFMRLSDGELVTSSQDKTIRIWDLDAPHKYKTKDRHIWGVYALLLHGRLLVSGSADRTVKAWNSGTMDVLASMDEHTERVEALAACGKVLISASHDSLVKIINLEDFTCLKTFRIPEACLTAAAATGLDKFLIGSTEGNLYRMDFAGNIFTKKIHESEIGRIIVDDNQVYTCSDDGSVAILDAKDLTVLHRLVHGRMEVKDMLLWDRRMITACSDGRIRVWDSGSLECIQTLASHQGCVEALIRCEDKLVSGSADHTIKVWDMESGECLATYVYDVEILSLASRDGMIYAGANDGRVLWFQPISAAMG